MINRDGGGQHITARLGDSAWREVLSVHYEAARTELERFRGREVETTGDGLLATFVGPRGRLRRRWRSRAATPGRCSSVLAAPASLSSRDVTSARATGSLSPAAPDAARHMLRLDADLSGFYEAAREDPDLAWACAGAGRMLRSPTVFEEVIKTV